jgi:hypothetical protein
LSKFLYNNALIPRYAKTAIATKASRRQTGSLTPSVTSILPPIGTYANLNGKSDDEFRLFYDFVAIMFAGVGGAAACRIGIS